MDLDPPERPSKENKLTTEHIEITEVTACKKIFLCVLWVKKYFSKSSAVI